MTSTALPDMPAIRRILDMYMNSAVAIVGCHSVGLSRNSCELDVLVVSPDARPSTTAKLARVPVDLFFSTEKESLKPSNPEYSVSLAFAKPIRDSALVLSTSFAANSAVLSEASRQGARGRLASALKGLGRSEDALARGSRREADFWLQAAAFDFGYAWVFSNEALPCPSHLLSQLRGLSKEMSRSFEAYSLAAGLDRGSREACVSRVEGIAIIHDIVRRRRDLGAGDQSSWPVARTEIVRAKAEELLSSSEGAECYSYLGIEAVRSLAATTRRAGRGPVGDPGQARIATLFTGEKKLLGERLLADLGFGREKSRLTAGIEALKGQVPRLAKRS